MRFTIVISQLISYIAQRGINTLLFGSTLGQLCTLAKKSKTCSIIRPSIFRILPETARFCPGRFIFFAV